MNWTITHIVQSGNMENGKTGKIRLVLGFEMKTSGEETENEFIN